MRPGSIHPFQLSRMHPSSSNWSMAVWTVDIQSRQSDLPPIALATSLGQMVAPGARSASRAIAIWRAASMVSGLVTIFRPFGRGRWFKRAIALQSACNERTERGPCRTDAPSRKDIAGPMHAEIDPRRPDDERQRHGHRQQIDTDMPSALGPSQQAPKVR